MKVSVSILNEYDRLINAVKKVNHSIADYLHIDVMDGKFVNNKKFSPEIIKDIKLISKKPLDIHLMVMDNEIIKEYARLLPEYIIFHVEIMKDKSLIDYIKSLNVKVGLAINPSTDISKLYKYIDDIDMVLFMSVNPGLPGQKFIKETINRINEFKKNVSENILISIDGGVNEDSINLCKSAGCDMVVSGSYVTNSNNYNEKILNLIN